MTTTVVNNSVFRGFFEKQKLFGPNFIDWYRQLRIVLSTEDKLNYLELPIPVAHVPAVAGQQVPPETLAAHAAWVKGQKEIDVLMLIQNTLLSVNGVKFVVHERDILHTTQCSGVSTPGLDGEMYYGQLEEILELTYIGHRKVVLFRCKWFDTINPKNHTTRNRRSYIDQGIHHILTDREFHRNNQYILATQVTQVFYLQDLARQPRGWKVVEHVYHRDVAESDQDVIHGSSSSHVTLSVGLTNLEHTDLSINAQSTEVDAPPVNDDNANANEDNADFINNEDDVVAHVLDDDDDDDVVVVSDDDEVNPSTNVEEMACVAPRSHGGDAGGSPPRQPTRPVPAQCQSSMLRLETGNRSLRKAFRENNEQPLKIGFDYEDLGTFHPLGNFSGMLNSLMGETVRPLPLACEWEEIPEAYKAHIYPTLESYFNLAEWYNKQDKVVVDRNVYTVGERVRLGLELKLRLLWRKNKNRIKADHYAKHTSPDEAKNHPPPPKVWGERTQDDWNELVDWWSQPDRVSRSLQNAANRAKNTIITHQGKKSFAQGRNEYKVDKGYYEDLIETWRKGHSNKKTGQFKTTENKQRYLDMKAMQDNVKAGLIPFKTDQEILDEIVPSDNRQNMSGMGRKLPGGGSTSRRRANRAFGDIMTRDQITQMFRQQEQEKELHRKQAEEAQARAYLASLKADAADQRANVAQQNSEANNAALDGWMGVVLLVEYEGYSGGELVCWYGSMIRRVIDRDDVSKNGFECRGYGWPDSLRKLRVRPHDWTFKHRKRNPSMMRSVDLQYRLALAFRAMKHLESSQSMVEPPSNSYPLPYCDWLNLLKDS
ncbi:Myc-type, basic helix-loop-helix domain-containing protein [Tanacetum coccineum]